MIKANSPALKTLSKIRVTVPFSELSEIRVRAGRPAVSVDIFGNMRICSEVFSAEEIAACFAEICGYSTHSYEEQIARGYIALDGGHRVGICGTAVRTHGKIEFFKDISGLNFRIAHEVIGCSDEIFRRCFSDGIISLLIVGKPLSGKTTILRDLARRLGERRRVTIIDSRGEISASVRGSPSLDVGLNTDVLCGCEKSEGIEFAVRTLSPEVIICDEISDDGDALENALRCGVKVIASAHAGSFGEVFSRPQTSSAARIFDGAVLLGERGKLVGFLENSANGKEGLS